MPIMRQHYIPSQHIFNLRICNYVIIQISNKINTSLFCTKYKYMLQKLNVLLIIFLKAFNYSMNQVWFIFTRRIPFLRMFPISIYNLKCKIKKLMKINLVPARENIETIN